MGMAKKTMEIDVKIALKGRGFGDLILVSWQTPVASVTGNNHPGVFVPIVSTSTHTYTFEVRAMRVYELLESGMPDLFFSR